MPRRGAVGKAIATALIKDERDIPDYEFPDSGLVKLSLTSSEIASLDGMPSEPEIQTKSLIVSKLSKRSEQIVRLRLLATVAVLITAGSFCIFLSCLARYAVRNAAVRQATFVGMLAFVTALLARDWYRFYGDNLSRTLKPVINIANLLQTFDTFTFDFLGIGGHLKINDKYIFTWEGPAINETIPRTPECG